MSNRELKSDKTALSLNFMKKSVAGKFELRRMSYKYVF